VAKTKNTYAIALTFSEKTAEKINNLRTDYQEFSDYVIDPHITLVYPFSPVFSLFLIYEQLEKIAKRTKQFSVVLNGIEFFENGNNVVYAALENRRTVKKLHTDIITSLEGLIKEWRTDGNFNLEMFVPHVTIGEHIPDSLFPDIKKQYSKYWIHYEEKITSFTFFHEKEGIWEKKRVFELAG
jgi:2'-5' RNA ligase